MKLLCLLLAIVVNFSAYISANQITTYTYIAPKIDEDPRSRYGAALFALALEKTLVSSHPETDVYCGCPTRSIC